MQQVFAWTALDFQEVLGTAGGGLLTGALSLPGTVSKNSSQYLVSYESSDTLPELARTTARILIAA